MQATSKLLNVFSVNEVDPWEAEPFEIVFWVGPDSASVKALPVLPNADNFLRQGPVAGGTYTMELERGAESKF